MCMNIYPDYTTNYNKCFPYCLVHLLKSHGLSEVNVSSPVNTSSSMLKLGQTEASRLLLCLYIDNSTRQTRDLQVYC